MAYQLVKSCSYEEEIRKSRFLAIATTIDSEQSGKDFLTQNYEPKATHNCWAWRLGENYKFNDDGEPGGTAGRPILQAIDQNKIDNVAVLVIRWFGGIKLGTGGLARAYGGVANSCLLLGVKEEIKVLVKLKGFCPYPLIDLITTRLHAFGVIVESAEYGSEGVDWVLLAPKSNMATVKSVFFDLTSGQSALKMA